MRLARSRSLLGDDNSGLEHGVTTQLAENTCRFNRSNDSWKCGVTSPSLSRLAARLDDYASSLAGLPDVVSFG